MGIARFIHRVCRATLTRRAVIITKRTIHNIIDVPHDTASIMCSGINILCKNTFHDENASEAYARYYARRIHILLLYTYVYCSGVYGAMFIYYMYLYSDNNRWYAYTLCDKNAAARFNRKRFLTIIVSRQKGNSYQFK